VTFEAQTERYLNLLQWTVSRPKLLTPELGRHVYPEGVESDLVGDRAEVSMMDSFGHLRIIQSPLVELLIVENSYK
jgi:hypothetical protein